LKEEDLFLSWEGTKFIFKDLYASEESKRNPSKRIMESIGAHRRKG